MKLVIPRIISRNAPKWTKKIRRVDAIIDLHESCVVNGQTLNIGFYHECLVGEMYDFADADDGNYGCDRCEKLANDFDSAVIDEKEEQFQYTLKTLAQHWKEDHNES